MQALEPYTHYVPVREDLSDLLAQLDARREMMRHMKAIVFVRPTAENIMHLRKELEAPRYGEYHIYFSNVARQTFLEELAEADEFEVVRGVHEHFADYIALNDDVFVFETTLLTPLPNVEMYVTSSVPSSKLSPPGVPWCSVSKETSAVPSSPTAQSVHHCL